MKNLHVFAALVISVSASFSDRAFAQDYPGSAVTEAPAESASVAPIDATLAKLHSAIGTAQLQALPKNLDTVKRNLNDAIDSTALKRFLYVTYYLRPANNRALTLTGAEVNQLIDHYLGSAGNSKAAIQGFFSRIGQVEMKTNEKGETTYTICGVKNGSIDCDAKDGNIELPPPPPVHGNQARVTMKYGTVLALSMPDLATAGNHATEPPSATGVVGHVVSEQALDSVTENRRKHIRDYVGEHSTPATAPPLPPLELATTDNGITVTVMESEVKMLKRQKLSLQTATIIPGVLDDENKLDSPAVAHLLIKKGIFGQANAVVAM